MTPHPMVQFSYSDIIDRSILKLSIQPLIINSLIYSNPSAVTYLLGYCKIICCFSKLVMNVFVLGLLANLSIRFVHLLEDSGFFTNQNCPLEFPPLWGAYSPPSEFPSQPSSSAPWPFSCVHISRSAVLRTRRCRQSAARICKWS